MTVFEVAGCSGHGLNADRYLCVIQQQRSGTKHVVVVCLFLVKEEREEGMGRKRGRAEGFIS